MPQCVGFKNIYAYSTPVSSLSRETVLTVQSIDIVNCQAYVLMTVNDYKAMQVTDIWAFDPVQSGQFFGFSFTLILSVYLVAWGYGQLLDFVRR